MYQDDSQCYRSPKCVDKADVTIFVQYGWMYSGDNCQSNHNMKSGKDGITLIASIEMFQILFAMEVSKTKVK